MTWRGEQRHVARRDVLLGIALAPGVGEMGMRHAELGRPLVHHVGEIAPPSRRSPSASVIAASLPDWMMKAAQEILDAARWLWTARNMAAPCDVRAALAPGLFGDLELIVEVKPALLQLVEDDLGGQQLGGRGQAASARRRSSRKGPSRCRSPATSATAALALNCPGARRRERRDEQGGDQHAETRRTKPTGTPSQRAGDDPSARAAFSMDQKSLATLSDGGDSHGWARSIVVAAPFCRLDPIESPARLRFRSANGGDGSAK